ncbi:MAG: hypothetical protein Q4D51_14955 [Eubacteriales bacterium]|nr:hypothetical protein [Eubacteriales bacterium]
MQSIYNIWNFEYIQQQEQKNHHFKQVAQTVESANKLREFLNSVDKVEPSYQQQLRFEVCEVLAEYARKHGIY